jgi:hypothetical protein
MEPFDYPFKFDPSDEPPWSYSPQNLRYRYGVVRWSYIDESELSRWAMALSAKIADHFLPWAMSLTALAAKEQLLKRGENAWCERLWIDDYNC